MRPLIRQSLSLLLVMTVLCGVLYPLAVTGLAQLAFPRQANGSLIVRDGRVLGSRLIGQRFRGADFSGAGHRPHRPIRTMPRPHPAPTWGRPIRPCARLSRSAWRSCAPPIPPPRVPFRRIWSPLPEAVWTRTSARRRRSTSWPGWRARGTCPRRRCRRWSTPRRAVDNWAYSASHESTCWNSICASTACGNGRRRRRDWRAEARTPMIGAISAARLPHGRRAQRRAPRPRCPA